MNRTKILIIDDDPTLVDITAKLLSPKGYVVEVANSGPEGLRKVFHTQPALILLDIMMQGMDGLEVLKRVREMSDLPVIMLSALNQTEVIVQALHLGADDFVRKPFVKDELLARIQSVLRRTLQFNQISSPHNYSDGYLSINLDERRVYVAGQSVRLTVTEYSFLEYLYLHVGNVCNYLDILENIWGGISGLASGRHYVHVYIEKLRNKIEINPGKPEYLLTEFGVGYRFERKK